MIIVTGFDLIIWPYLFWRPICWYKERMGHRINCSKLCHKYLSRIFKTV